MPPTRTIKQQPHADSPAPSSAAAAGNGASGAGSSTGEGTKQQQQRACVACRRSKVRCVHEGEPPCRRCADTRQECKFRVSWAPPPTLKERSHTQLAHIPSTTPAASRRRRNVARANRRYAYTPSVSRRSAASPPSSSGCSSTAAAAGAGHEALACHCPAAPAQLVLRLRSAKCRHATAASSTHSHAPVRSLTANDGESLCCAPSLRIAHSDAAMLPQSRHSHASPNYSDPMPDYHSPGGAHGDGSASMGAGGTNPTPDGSADVKEAAHRLHPVTTPGGSARSPAHAGPSTLAAPSTSYFYVRRAPPLHNIEQTSASPALLHVTSSTAPIYLPAMPAPPKWTFGMAQDYARPGVIGRDDPRLNAISMGVVPMERARSLFVL